nr:PD-(D/E)XK nuclease family protein [Thermoleophilaceae bacterium]
MPTPWVTIEKGAAPAASGLNSQLASLFDAPAAERTWTHISASQLGMFKRCPNQYRERYIRGIKERPGAALIWGSADHSAHEHNFRQKIESEKDLPVGDVTDAFDQAWRDRIDQAGGASQIEWDGDPDDMKTQAARLVEAYHHQASPMVQPIAVEREISLQLPGVRLPIKGYIDVETTNSIVERKTGKRKVSSISDKPDWGLQGVIYSAALDKPVFWHQAVKTKVPAVHVEGVYLDAPTEVAKRILAKDAQQTIEMIDHFMALYGPDEAWP